MRDYSFNNEITTCSPTRSFERNVKALAVLNKVSGEQALTDNVKEQLNSFNGWGGIADVFSGNDKWSEQNSAIKDHLDEVGYEAARRSILDSFYTPTLLINHVYDALLRFGVKPGRFIDPASGTGRFFGAMPDSLRKGTSLTAVEADPTPGNISKLLYPNANILSPMRFEDTQFEQGSFDVAVGNPPFGAKKISDKTITDTPLSIHNYFLTKSLYMLREGGILAMVVTSSLMDARNNTARTYMSSMANLLGAVRLPNTAFESAGTSVCTDILFFQKTSTPEANPAWIDTTQFVADDGSAYPINQYFIDNPDTVMGVLSVDNHMYGRPSLTCHDDGRDLSNALADFTATLPSNIYTEADVQIDNKPLELSLLTTVTPDSIKIYGLFLTEDDRLARRLPDVNEVRFAEYVDLPKLTTERARKLISLRNTLRSLIELESNNAHDLDIKIARDNLNVIYDAFTKKYGAIHSMGNTRAFKDDPDLPLLLSLESGYDAGVSRAMAKKHGTSFIKPSWSKADIFTARVITPNIKVEHADNCIDALSICLSEYGRVSLPAICELTGMTEEQILVDLHGKIYHCPETNIWVTSDEYLSGNVVSKFEAAKKASLDNPDYTVNAAALRDVQPVPLEAMDIHVKLGASWISSTDVSDFITYLIDEDNIVHYSAAADLWQLRCSPADDNVKNNATYGTDRMSADVIINKLLNNRTITVWDERYIGGKLERYVNSDDTLAANAKADEIKQAFEDWLWQDDDRRRRLVDIYNRTYNVFVKRSYDGSHLTFPGINPAITLRPNQRNAAWRTIQSSSTLLDHVVGSGKTYTCSSSVMEVQRMGLRNKSMIVVPNHLVLQWARDFLTLYPNANILIPTKRDFQSKYRQILFARIATGNWDAVIVPHSSFELIPMPADYHVSFLKDQICSIRGAIEAMAVEHGKSLSTKRLERKVEAIESKITDITNSKDKVSSLDFSQLGIDQLIVDESDEYKNLYFNTGMSNVAGLGNPPGSQKAFDMFMKVRFIQTNNGSVIFATGTPISNTIAEMFTLQRYMQYEELEARNLIHFDQWARVFANAVSNWELDATGVNYVLKSRLSQFVNIGELSAMSIQYQDVITEDDFKFQMKEAGIKWPVPPVFTGKPEMIVVEPSPAQSDYMTQIVKRAENKPKDPSIDNMLKITNDARKCSLDMRLVEEECSDFAKSKVNACVESVYSIWQQWDEHKGTQLVFCDLSTPKAARKGIYAEVLKLISDSNKGDSQAQQALANIPNAELISLNHEYSSYDDMKEKLVRKGIPVEQIAFIHDAKTDNQRQKLYENMNHGRVRVLIGSTRKLGAGTNVQRLLVASHHLDCPWRPRDIEQRDGRIKRQGNYLFETIKDFSIRILRYATKRTYDARMWQTVESKARSIFQLRKATPGVRVIEDVCQSAASYADLKAAATGNPFILEQVRLDSEVRQLETLLSQYKRKLMQVRDVIADLSDFRNRAKADVTNIKLDISTRDAKTTKKFSAIINGSTLTKRSEASKLVEAAAKHFISNRQNNEGVLCQYRGFTISIYKHYFGYAIKVSGENRRYTSALDGSKVSGKGIFTRVDHLLNGLESRIDIVLEQEKKDERNLRQALLESRTPFDKQNELDRAQSDLNIVLAELELMKDKTYKARTVEEVLGAPATHNNQDEVEHSAHIDNDTNAESVPEVLLDSDSLSECIHDDVDNHNSLDATVTEPQVPVQFSLFGEEMVA